MAGERRCLGRVGTGEAVRVAGGCFGGVVEKPNETAAALRSQALTK